MGRVRGGETDRNMRYEKKYFKQQEHKVTGHIVPQPGSRGRLILVRGFLLFSPRPQLLGWVLLTDKVGLPKLI